MGRISTYQSFHCIEEHYIYSRGAGLTDSEINGSEPLVNLLVTIRSYSPFQ
jgi:hypothetical protein